MTERLSIFVPHASDWLTDSRAHGDGLVAFEVLNRLALRGHLVDAVAPQVEIRAPLPATLRLYRLPAHGAGPRLRYMLEVRRLFDRLSRNRRFDLIHQLNPVATGISLAFAGCGVPVVLGSFIADWPSEQDRGWLARLAGDAKRAVAALQQQHARALIVTTPHARARIVAPRRHARKIVQLPHGIDPSAYPLPGEPPDGPPTILFLGGIEGRKGIFTLLDALPLVQATFPDCRLVVGGEGHAYGDVCRRVEALPAPQSVELLGRVARERVPELFAQAHVFAMPSLGEPFGMSLLEAMACGKAVVVSDAGGPRHIVDADGGRKVPPNDPVALAGALVEVLGSPALRAAMGAHNRAKVETIYHWDHVIDALEGTYRAMLPSAS